MVDYEDTALKLASQAHDILQNPEVVYDLTGKRLALISALTQNHFTDIKNGFRLAIVGNPNTGKTTFSYSVSEILKLYRVPCTYIDLDLYTNSGKAISGEIEWKERNKRSADNIPEAEIMKNIKDFSSPRIGITIGDFPGKINNEFQPQRLKGVNLALILAHNKQDADKWMDLCSTNGIRFRFLISEDDHILYPQAVDFKRKTVFSIPNLIYATSVLKEAVEKTNGPKIPFDSFFSQPELVILEEVLDFKFSIQNV